MKFISGICVGVMVGLLLISCKHDTDNTISLKPESVATDLQKALIEAKSGTVIQLPEGTFSFQRSISLNDTPDIKIIGAGKKKTILSFKEQIEGAEGILIKGVKGITLEGFSVQDSKGDAIKIQGCEEVIMRDLEATWTSGQLPTNGAYGLYPVSSKNVLMENCEASYAMDAGIYVGQSTNVVVRENYVHHNVAGLEIENTICGEVYNNIAQENTGGMLIFDMPDLPQANGDRIKFYNNLMENNNGPNFAPKGMVVSTIPPGSGMIIMAHSNIEMHHNTIKNHKTLGVAVNSWLSSGVPFESEAYDPYSTSINIHDNIISDNQGPVDNTTDYGKLLTAVAGDQPFDIVMDGFFKPSILDDNGRPQGICIKNNGDITLINLNMAKGTDPVDIINNIEKDLTFFDCELTTFDTKEHDAWLVKDTQ